MTERRPRYRTIDRLGCSHVCLDEQLPDDHPVRTLWQFTSLLDFADFAADVKAVEGHPGKPPWPPQLLFTLWLFALIDGVYLARELARRCRRDLPYQWLCGGQAPDYHTLSDFHAQHHDRIHKRFVEQVAALRSQGLIRLKRVALDGTKRPGNAGNASHHREPTLQRHLEQAEQLVRDWQEGRVQAERLSGRQRAARQRAARQRAERLRRAVHKVQQLQQARHACKRSTAKPEEARANEADPDAVRMKQGDGGFRVGYNVQTVTDAAHGLVVSTDVICQGNDSGQLSAQLLKVKREQGVVPEEVLVDAGYASLDDVEQAEKAGTRLLMPPRDEKKDRQAGRDPYTKKKGDGPEIVAWRQRMGTAEAQQVYKQRSGLAEIIHARMEQRKWYRFRLRGQQKAATEGLWQALAHNVSRLLALGWLLRSAGTVRAGAA
jgi:transposase